ncbi:hypothetical protein, partial [Enterococcus faecalis]|uniref:hypothetical protein n=1 Tax=Enterococcus faecalis TaxID=1351 RepID=UPI003CC66D14
VKVTASDVSGNKSQLTNVFVSSNETVSGKDNSKDKKSNNQGNNRVKNQFLKLTQSRVRLIGIWLLLVVR